MIHRAGGGWVHGVWTGRLGGRGCQARLWWQTGGGVAWLEPSATNGDKELLAGVATNGDVKMLVGVAAFLVLSTGGS